MMHTGTTFESAALPLVGNLYRAAFRMVHDEGAAERFVERTFLKGRRRLHHLQDVDSLRRRMFAILFCELHKRRKAWLNLKALFTCRTDVPQDYADQDEMLRELDRIPGVLREVILVVDIEGFNKSEAAEILEIAPDLVATRLAQGRARLRAAFREERSLA
jgi:RNA polymerase sigma-70 factor (ECF subfamily)